MRLPILIAALLCATGASAQADDFTVPADTHRAREICTMHKGYYVGNVYNNGYEPGWEMCAKLDADKEAADHDFVEQYLKDTEHKP